MRSRTAVYSIWTAISLLLLGVAPASAQMPGPPPAPGPGHNTFYLRTFGLEDNKVVTGVPYSAQATTETTQVLSDGNRIVCGKRRQKFTGTAAGALVANWR